MKSNFWRVFLVVAVVSALLLAAGMLAALNHLDQMPVHVMVNGVGMPELLDLHAPSTAHQLTLVVVLAAVMLLGLVLLPVLVLLMLLSVAFALCLAFGIGLLMPALVVALLTALILSPLLLLGWALWRLLRRRPDAPVAATIQP